MDNIFNIKPGDIILIPKENTRGIYDFVTQKFGKGFADLLAKLYSHNYIHAELSLGNDWQIGAWFDGVKVWKVPINYYTLVHVYRLKPEFKKNFTKDEILEAAKRHFNKECDFPSLILNTIITFLSLGNDSRERALEADFTYYSRDKMICSELVAQVYEELGYTIERTAEYTTPDDIAQSKLFYRVL